MLPKQPDFYEGYSFKYVNEHMPRLGRILEIEGGYFLEIAHTIVAAVDSNKWFYVLGLFDVVAQNTLRRFAKEYAGLDDWNTVRMLYKNSEKYNMDTGEVVPITSK